MKALVFAVLACLLLAPAASAGSTVEADACHDPVECVLLLVVCPVIEATGTPCEDVVCYPCETAARW